MRIQSNIIIDKNSCDEYYIINTKTGAKFTIHIAGKVFCLCPDTVTKGDVERAKNDDMDISKYIGEEAEDVDEKIFKIFVKEYLTSRYSLESYN